MLIYIKKLIEYTNYQYYSPLILELDISNRSFIRFTSQDSSINNVKVLCAKPNRYKDLSVIQRKSSKRYSIKTFWIPSHSNSFLSQSFSYSFFFFKHLFIQFLFKKGLLYLEQALLFYFFKLSTAPLDEKN